MGCPAITWYCLGRGPATNAGAESDGDKEATRGTTMAREPVPAQGISAQKRAVADKETGVVGNRETVMGPSF